MSTNEESDLFIDRVFDGATGQSPDTKWAVGITLLADVLLTCETELEREKMMNGLWRELRDALVGIPAIMRNKLN